MRHRPDLVFVMPEQRLIEILVRPTINLRGYRDEVQKELANSGISTAVYYPLPLHHMKVFTGRFETATGLERSESLCLQVLSLPTEPLMTVLEIEHTIKKLLSVLGSRK